MKFREVFLALGLIFIAGCTTIRLQTEVFEKIHEGDSKDHVVQILGQPDSFAASQRIAGGAAWYYARNEDYCALTIVDNIVKIVQCVRNPNYVSPEQQTALILKGLGESRAPASNSTPIIAPVSYPISRPTNCTTSYVGRTAYTNCN